MFDRIVDLIVCHIQEGVTFHRIFDLLYAISIILEIYSDCGELLNNKLDARILTKPQP